MTKIRVQHINETKDHDVALQDLAQSLTLWQKNKKFMRFLKETPTSLSHNLDILKQQLASEHASLHTIHIPDITIAVGYLLFHCFDSET